MTKNKPHTVKNMTGTYMQDGSQTLVFRPLINVFD